MNEQSLDTLANVAITLAAFSGVVVAFRVRGVHTWSPDALWGLCSALLGSWFFVGDFLTLRGERRDHAAQQWITVPVVTPILYGIYLVVFVMGILLLCGYASLDVPSHHEAALLAALGVMFGIGRFKQLEVQRNLFHRYIFGAAADAVVANSDVV